MPLPEAITSHQPPQLTAQDCAPLFKPLTVGKLDLRSRLVMSAMTRLFAKEGALPPEAAEYYARRARHGVGLIITEATTVDHEVAHYTGTEPYMFGEGPLESWRRVVERVHEAGGAIFPQLWHTGLDRQWRTTPNPEADSISAMAISSRNLFPAGPDGKIDTGGRKARAATEEDLADVIAAFGRSAAHAKAVGFDGIAIHGGHGYLIHQFAWERSNQRTDAWGGSISARGRLGVEIVKEIRRQVGEGFPIAFRFSQWTGWDYKAHVAADPAELEVFLGPLADAGVDLFDASTRRFWEPAFPGSDLNLAGWAKKLTGRLGMTVGSVGLGGALSVKNNKNEKNPTSLEHMPRLLEMLNRGDFDLVGVGRALLANPDWAQIIREGRWSDLSDYDAVEVAQALV